VRDQRPGSWWNLVAYAVIASAVFAGGIHASWWWVVLIALLLSLTQWDALAERAKDVSQEPRRSGRRPGLAEAHAAVLAASFLLHYFLCALAYFFGGGLAWLLWELAG
jgi:hypothetical protein